MWGKFAETRKAHEVKIKRLEDAAVHYICQVGVFFSIGFLTLSAKKSDACAKILIVKKGLNRSTILRHKKQDR